MTDFGGVHGDPEVLGPVSGQGLAVLRHPDQRSGWVIILMATLRTSGVDGREQRGNLARRLGEIHRELPIVGARLRGETWWRGVPPAIEAVPDDPLQHPRLTARFQLAEEPPVRFLVTTGGDKIAMAAHHAALDGLGAVGVLGALLGQDPPVDEPAPAPRPSAGMAPMARRLLLPSDPVAPSTHPPASETLASRCLTLTGRGVTARIVAAAIPAIAEHNRRLTRPWRRIGLSIGVGGRAGIGNFATYRRVDLHAHGDVLDAVRDALRCPADPAEFSRTLRLPRLASPLADRLSDSLLVSNLGRQAIPNARALEFFPVARGRSAVAFGGAAVEDGASMLTIRSRDLSRDDATTLLDDVVRRLDEAAS